MSAILWHGRLARAARKSKLHGRGAHATLWGLTLHSEGARYGLTWRGRLARAFLVQERGRGRPRHEGCASRRSGTVAGRLSRDVILHELPARVLKRQITGW